MHYVYYSEKTPESCSIALAWAFHGEPSRIAYSVQRDPTSTETYWFKLRKLTTDQRQITITFYGTIMPHETGSIIEGHFYVDWLEKVLVAALFLPICGFSALLIVIGLIEIFAGRGSSNMVCGTLVFWCTLVCATLAIAIRRNGYTCEERYIAGRLLNIFPKDVPDSVRNVVHGY